MASSLFDSRRKIFYTSIVCICLAFVFFVRSFFALQEIFLQIILSIKRKKKCTGENMLFFCHGQLLFTDRQISSDFREIFL